MNALDFLIGLALGAALAFAVCAAILALAVRATPMQYPTDAPSGIIELPMQVEA